MLIDSTLSSQVLNRNIVSLNTSTSYMQVSQKPMLSNKLQRKAPESEENPRKLVAHDQIPGLHIPASKPRRARRRGAEKARLMRKKVTLSKQRTNRDQELQLAQVRKVEMWETKWRLKRFSP